MDRDFEIGSRKFKLNKIDAFKQFAIMRRMAPILGDMIGAIQGKSDKDDPLKIIAPIFDGLSKMSDSDAEKVLIGLCSAVEMQQASFGNWAKVATESNGLTFKEGPDALDLPDILHIAIKSFWFNAESFFAKLPQVSPDTK